LAEDHPGKKTGVLLLASSLKGGRLIPLRIGGEKKNLEELMLHAQQGRHSFTNDYRGEFLRKEKSFTPERTDGKAGARGEALIEIPSKKRNRIKKRVAVKKGVGKEFSGA